MGVMALGFSFGGALDVAGTLYHMLNHSPNKSLMFFGAGNMMRAYDAKRIAGIYTYLSRAERRVRRSGHVRGAGPGLGLAAKRDCKERRPHPQFLPLLRTELAFYVGCLNLHERLLKLQAPFAYPRATRPETVRFHCIERYDVTLALRKSGRPVANHVNANGKTLIVATGDNQGGKTTFLRSFGLAQLMMQAGCSLPRIASKPRLMEGAGSSSSASSTTSRAALRSEIGHGDVSSHRSQRASSSMCIGRSSALTPRRRLRHRTA